MLAPSTSRLGERQTNDQAVQQVGMQQGCEDQWKLCPLDQRAHSSLYPRRHYMINAQDEGHYTSGFKKMVGLSQSDKCTLGSAREKQKVHNKPPPIEM